jgi:hypothetical protein
MFGVRTSLLPVEDNSSDLSPSPKKQTMFGFPPASLMFCANASKASSPQAEAPATPAMYFKIVRRVSMVTFLRQELVIAPKTTLKIDPHITGVDFQHKIFK